MKTILVLAISFIVTSAFGQTKTIYAKRNGLRSTNELLAYPDHISSNLGAAPERWVRNSRLEKVVLLNDTTAVMTTREDCIETFSSSQTRWKAGSDTLYHHPIFCADIPVDTMRNILAGQYYFVNDMNQVKFEGFDKKEKGTREEKKEKEIIMHREESEKLPQKRNKRPAVKWIILLVLATSAAGALKLR